MTDEFTGDATVLFFACGADPSIPDLATRLDCQGFEPAVRIGDELPKGAGIAERNYISVTVTSSGCEATALEYLTDWLIRHRDALSQLDATKTVEVWTAIPLQFGSRFLTLSLDIVRLCAETGCQIRHQYVKELEPRETLGRSN